MAIRAPKTCKTWEEIDAICEDEWFRLHSQAGADVRECRAAESEFKRAESRLATHGAQEGLLSSLVAGLDSEIHGQQARFRELASKTNVAHSSRKARRKSIAAVCPAACVPTLKVQAVGARDKVPVAGVSVKLFNAPCSCQRHGSRCCRDDLLLHEAVTGADGYATLPKFFQATGITTEKDGCFPDVRDYDAFEETSDHVQFAIMQSSSLLDASGQAMLQSPEGGDTADGQNTADCAECTRAIDAYKATEEDIIVNKAAMEDMEAELTILQSKLETAKSKEDASRSKGMQLEEELQTKKDAWLAVQASCAQALEDTEGDIAEWMKTCREKYYDQSCEAQGSQSHEEDPEMPISGGSEDAAPDPQMTGSPTHRCCCEDATGECLWYPQDRLIGRFGENHCPRLWMPESGVGGRCASSRQCLLDPEKCSQTTHAPGRCRDTSDTSDASAFFTGPRLSSGACGRVFDSDEEHQLQSQISKNHRCCCEENGGRCLWYPGDKLKVSYFTGQANCPRLWYPLTRSTGERCWSHDLCSWDPSRCVQTHHEPAKCEITREASAYFAGPRLEDPACERLATQ